MILFDRAGAFGVLLVGLLSGAPAACAATVQQDFDAAQALLDAGKTVEARAAFTALLARLSPGSKGQAASLVRARLGTALIDSGNAAAAEPLLTAAVAGFTRTDAQTVSERGTATFDLGRAQELQGKLDSAARSYRQVLAAKAFAPDTPSDIGLRAALARSVIWSNPAEARQLLDALLALSPATFGKSRDTFALLKTLRGRVELNNGNPAEARRWFIEATQAAGGAETRSINVADVRIRSDLALANFKLGRMDEVQKFVALSGSGSLVDEGMTLAGDTPLPACAPATGLAPDAVAVVEFAIGDDGRVKGVTPVYASRGSGTRVAGIEDDGPEVQFPQAVRRWVWSTDKVAKLSPFWRQAVRVELRCFTARPDINPVSASFNAAHDAWAASAGVAPMPDLPDNDAEALPLIRAELARREASGGTTAIQLEQPLAALAKNEAASREDRAAAVTRRTTLLQAAGAPIDVIGPARIGEIHWTARQAGTSRQTARATQDRLAPLLAMQINTGHGATRAAMYTRLELAESQQVLKATTAARALLDEIVAAPPTLLPDGDPIRTSALLRLSNIAAAERDTAAAAATLAATGLSPEQCSLIDVRPLPVNASVGNSSFPDEARRWSTGGFARVGYDITADGRPAGVRTIIASPPFIFGPATEKAVGRFRYEPVFRPGNTVGCSGQTQSVRYQVAG